MEKPLEEVSDELYKFGYEASKNVNDNDSADQDGDHGVDHLEQVEIIDRNTIDIDHVKENIDGSNFEVDAIEGTNKDADLKKHSNKEFSENAETFVDTVTYNDTEVNHDTATDDDDTKPIGDKTTLIDSVTDHDTTTIDDAATNDDTAANDNVFTFTENDKLDNIDLQGELICVSVNVHCTVNVEIFHVVN